MQLDRLSHRLARLLAVSLGLLPFLDPWRWPPQPALWEEWATCLVACLWLMVVGRRRPPAEARRFGAVEGILLGLAALTGLQAAAGWAAQPLTALLCAAVLLLAAQLNRVMREAPDAERTQWLRDWGLGTLLALYANGAGELLGLAGYEWLGWHIVPSVHPPRAIGLQGQSNQLADLMVFALAAAVLRFRPGRWAWPRLLLHVVVAAALCGATASRSGAIGWVAGLLIALALLRRHPHAALGSGRSLAFACAGLLPLISPLVWPHISPQVLPLGSALTASFTALLGLTPDLAAPGPQPGPVVSLLRTSTAGRGDMLWGAWQLWLAHPVFGVGYGGYAGARFFELDGPLYSPNSTHAHNLLAQVAAEWGTVGLLAVLLPIGVALWRWRRAGSGQTWLGAAGSERRLHNGAILIAWTTVMVHSQVELPLWFCYYLLPIALLSGAWRGGTAPVCAPAAKDRPGDGAQPAGGAQSRRWIGGLAGLALTGLVGLDYHRLQVQALDMMGLRGGRPALTAQATLARAGDISALTAFPTYAELMYLRAIGHDAMLAPLSLDITRRVLTALPSAETITHHLIALALLNRSDEARRLLDRMKQRNAKVHGEILARLALAQGEAPVVSVLL